MFDLEPSQIPFLKTVLIDEFQALYYRFKKDQIYAFTLVLDEFYAVDYVTISTEKSLFNDIEDAKQYLAEDDKWDIKKWKYRSNNINDGLNLLKNSMQEYFQESILSKAYINSSSGMTEHNSLKIYIEGMRQAKEFLTTIYRLKPEQVLFFISMHNKHEVAIQSAIELNTSSSLLYEFIANIKTVNIKTKPSVEKLSQLDKDLLIDLAQIVENVEPYDPLFIAHQAYLLSLEPYFLEVNPYIQNLISHIAAIDGDQFALDKEEILDRIKQFYKV